MSARWTGLLLGGIALLYPGSAHAFFGIYGGVSNGIWLDDGDIGYDLGIGETGGCFYGICARVTPARFSAGINSDYETMLRVGKAEDFPGLSLQSVTPGGEGRWSFLNAGLGAVGGYYGLLVMPYYMADFWSTDDGKYRHIVGLDLGMSYYFAAWLSTSWQREEEVNTWSFRIGIGAGTPFYL